MDFFEFIFSNNTLVVAILAWFIAQVSKGILALCFVKKFDMDRFIGSGGMPSSHSALVAAMATSVFINEGYNSTMFAVAFLFAFVVIYDAAGVRYAVGQQAKIINQLIVNWDSKDPTLFDRKVKEFLGHTKLEVIVGVLLGIAIALGYYTWVVKNV